MKNNLIDRAKRAIDIAKANRHIHVQWRDYCQSHPEYVGDAGTIEHHIHYIKEYDFIIEVLNEVINSK